MYDEIEKFLNDTPRPLSLRDFGSYYEYIRKKLNSKGYDVRIKSLDFDKYEIEIFKIDIISKYDDKNDKLLIS